jgi:adenylosuccinate lyase
MLTVAAAVDVACVCLTAWRVRLHCRQRVLQHEVGSSTMPHKVRCGSVVRLASRLVTLRVCLR